MFHTYVEYFCFVVFCLLFTGDACATIKRRRRRRWTRVQHQYENEIAIDFAVAC